MNQGELTLPATRASGLGFAGRIRRSGLIAPALIFAIVVTQAPFVLTICENQDGRACHDSFPPRRPFAPDPRPPIPQPRPHQPLVQIELRVDDLRPIRRLRHRVARAIVDGRAEVVPAGDEVHLVFDRAGFGQSLKMLQTREWPSG